MMMQDRYILGEITSMKKHLHTYSLRYINTHTKYTISTHTQSSLFSKFVKERNDAVFVGEFQLAAENDIGAILNDANWYNGRRKRSKFEIFKRKQQTQKQQ